jgi:hypothetical protein
VELRVQQGLNLRSDQLSHGEGGGHLRYSELSFSMLICPARSGPRGWPQGTLFD